MGSLEVYQGNGVSRHLLEWSIEMVTGVWLERVDITPHIKVERRERDRQQHLEVSSLR